MHRLRQTRVIKVAIVLAAASVVFLGVPVTPGLFAQARNNANVAQPPTPQWQIDAGGKADFDAVSVRSDRSGGGGHNNLAQSGGHVAMASVSLLQLIGQAFKFASLSDATNMIVGMPGWANSERFDVDAEADGNPTVDQKRLMLQSLLASRFKLAVHREVRQKPVYTLLLARPGRLGPQIHPYRENRQCNEGPEANTGAPQQPEGSLSAAEAAAAALRHFPCGRVVGGLIQANDHDQIWSGGLKVSMDSIAASIGEMEAMDRPVLNRTGLAGSFDFTIEWNHQLQKLSTDPSPETSGLSLLQAVREQLGLKLEPTRGPVQVLVIDHVEEPLPN